MTKQSPILFKLTAANDGKLPINTSIELEVNFLGLKVLEMGFPIIKDPSCILDETHQTKLLREVG